MNKKFDYEVLEREYVTGDMSLRELAESVGMKNHSLIMRQSKKRGWTEKRREFREASQGKALIEMADERGHMIAREQRVRENAIDAIDDMITRLREDLKKTKTIFKDGAYVEVPLVEITPNDIAVMIDRMNVLFGKPSQIHEDRTLGIDFQSADPELLRAFVEASRGVGDGGGTSSTSPLPVAPASSPGG